MQKRYNFSRTVTVGASFESVSQFGDGALLLCPVGVAEFFDINAKSDLEFDIVVDTKKPRGDDYHVMKPAGRSLDAAQDQFEIASSECVDGDYPSPWPWSVDKEFTAITENRKRKTLYVWLEA